MKLFLLIISAVWGLSAFAQFDNGTVYQGRCQMDSTGVHQQISIKVENGQLIRETIVFNSRNCNNRSGSYVRRDVFTINDIQSGMITLTFQSRHIHVLSQQVMIGDELKYNYFPECEGNQMNLAQPGQVLDRTCGGQGDIFYERYESGNSWIEFERLGPNNGNQRMRRIQRRSDVEPEGLPRIHQNSEAATATT